MSKILIADDDVDFVETLTDRLVAQGYQVIKAHEGVSAVELAQMEGPDLILLDWRMPFGKGSAVLEMLQEKEMTRKIPVIILSGIDEPGMKKTADHLGVKAFLRKPYDPKELQNTIAMILAGSLH